jgi:long-subunit fatty acid transport protein
MASLRYTYLPESYLQAGLSYDYSSSSVFSVNNAGDLTLNAQSTSVFASLNHRILPKLYGSIVAQFQNSTYYGGTVDGEAQQYYLIGLNLQYRFTPNFSADVGYNYDNVQSGVSLQQGYDRNRVYVGVTGSY